MSPSVKAYYKTPLGTIEITGSETGIASLYFIEDIPVTYEVPVALQHCVQQLDEYFSGKRTTFSLQLDLQGTDFQKKVWKELVQIPFGKTCSYLDLSLTLGDRKAIRAVGGANGKNPVSIIVPCHRVIGSNAKLTGYAGGLWRKEWLLNFENPVKQGSIFS